MIRFRIPGVSHESIGEELPLCVLPILGSSIYVTVAFTRRDSGIVQIVQDVHIPIQEGSPIINKRDRSHRLKDGKTEEIQLVLDLNFTAAGSFSAPLSRLSLFCLFLVLQLLFIKMMLSIEAGKIGQACMCTSQSEQNN